MKLSRRRDQNVRLFCDGRHIDRACVAVDDRCVLMHQQHADRSPDHQRTPDHRRLLALWVDAVVAQKLHRRLRRAGRKADLCVGEHTGQRRVCAAVHILFGIEHPARALGVQLLRQRTEEQNPVDVRILVDGGKRFVEFVLRHVLPQHKVLHAHADRFAALDGVSLVGEIVRAFADTYDTERGNDPTLRKRCRFLTHPADHGVGDRFALQNLCHLIRKSDTSR